MVNVRFISNLRNLVFYPSHAFFYTLTRDPSRYSSICFNKIENTADCWCFVEQKAIIYAVLRWRFLLLVRCSAISCKSQRFVVSSPLVTLSARWVSDCYVLFVPLSHIKVQPGNLGRDLRIKILLTRALTANDRGCLLPFWNKVFKMIDLMYSFSILGEFRCNRFPQQSSQSSSLLCFYVEPYNKMLTRGD